MATIEDIALCMTPGLGTQGAAHLIECFSSAKNIFSASQSELSHFAKLSTNVAKKIVNKEGFSAAEREIKHCQRYDITPISVCDALYPPLLLEAGDRPHVIYVKGNTNILTSKALSIVGTRKLTPYGERACNSIVENLASRVKKFVVVSGLAFGADAAAHRAALGYDVPTIAVLPNSLPGVTPAQNTALARDIVDSGGALVSELHSQTKNNGQLYLSRNRIIAAFSALTLLVESPLRGGSMATARMAHDYARIVGALPGRITDSMSRGCNMLIRDGVAQAITSGEDIIREMMWDIEEGLLNEPTPRRASRPQIELSADERGLLCCFRGDDPLHISTLQELSALSAGELSSLLVTLEIAGAIRVLPGNLYERLIDLT
ncbi:MAG: DNA-processing protein DprA [Rikenellaceae bacterium]